MLNKNMSTTATYGRMIVFRGLQLYWSVQELTVALWGNTFDQLLMISIVS